MKRATLSPCRVFVYLVVSIVAVAAKAEGVPVACYPEAPAQLVAKAEEAADDIVTHAGGNWRTNLAFVMPDVVIFAVADAIAPGPTRALEAYRYLAETKRTDKQIGASATAEGSTSATEKPGFTQLLGFAIENGAIEKQNNGTSLTLSATPYSVLIGPRRDTAETYQHNEFLRRLGFSATFKLASGTSDLANVNREQMTEWSARMRFGDHSARSKYFQDRWETEIKPHIVARLNAMSEANRVVHADPATENLEDQLQQRLENDINTQLGKAGVSLDDQKTEIKRLMVCGAKEMIVDPIAAKTKNVSEATRSTIQQHVIPSLAATLHDLDTVRPKVDQLFEDLNDRPLATLEYTNHRTTVGSDYSDLKLLFEENVWSPFKLNANAGVSIHHDPDPMLHQERFRGAAGSVSLEAKVDSPFQMGATDLSQMTLAFTGRYERLQQNAGVAGKKADIAVAQFKLDIPIAMGLSVPLSVTYANATELVNESKVRGNFGVTLDTDKLYALGQLLLAQR
jgi:hypothetical protein